MKPRTNPLLHPSRLALVAITFGALPALAGTTWDGGGGADTNINTPANWDLETLPDLTGPASVTFPTASGTATINTPVEFVRTTISNSFTLGAGDGTLTYRGTSSGANAYGILATSGAANVQINEAVLVEAVSTASPLGNLFLIYNNRLISNTTNLSINGGISLAPSSTVASYTLRYGNNTSLSTSTSDTRIAGTISGMGTLQNSSFGGNWAGDLIIAGDQASLTTTDISIAGSGFLAPTATARLVLGETSADDQTWRNITLNNVMNLAIGGTIDAAAFSGNTSGTSITGYGSGGTISFTSGTIGANVALGGAGTDQNNLSITKKGSGILTISSTTATYTGATTVETGSLTISSALSLASPLTVLAGAALSGEPTTTSSITFGSGTSTLNFDPTTPGSLTAAGLTVTGATVIANPSGATTIGVPYTVLTNSSGNFSAGDVSAFLAGGRGTISGEGTNQITYTPTASASLIWKGNDITNPTFWDISSTFNWNSGSPDRFFANDNVTFDDTASTFNVVVQGSSVSPGNIVFDNLLANPYTLSGGGIGGGGSLTKNGAGAVTIGNSLSHSGGIVVNSGILSLGTVNTNTFTGGISITGGELQFGGATLAGSLNAQPVTMTGGTLARIATTATTTNDVQTFAMNANGATIKVDTDTNTTWRIGGKISGSGNWTKSGPGVLALGQGNDTGPGNDFSGTLTVTGGTLDIRHSDSLGTTAGSTSVQDAILLMQNFSQTSGSTYLVNEPLNFSGTAFLNGYNQENKTFTQQFNGPLTISASSVLGISTARNSSGALAPLLELNSSTITIGSDSVMSLGLRPAALPANISASAQTINIGSSVGGSGAVTVRGEVGSVYTLTSPGYSGNTTVNSATLKLNTPNTNNQSSTVTIAATGATLELNFDESGGAVTDTVDKLFIGGVQQIAGTYKADDNVTDSGFQISQITGPGTLTVSTGPTGFNAWATANGIPGALPGNDADFDSLSNLAEYALGTNPTASTPSPGTWSGDTISFTKGAAAIANADVNFIIETSTDLGVNDPWAPAVTQNAPDASTTIAYTFTPGSPARKFARLRSVLIP